ncbi:uncharacterized protein [Apostichopus japonicus]|uniref:uncharacterized protein n=1 Tax=Stichopus japonicus TaxID=307972 RepID=UPI003AB6266A
MNLLKTAMARKRGKEKVKRRSKTRRLKKIKSRPFASEEVGCDRKVLSWMAKTNLDDQCPSSPFPSFPSSSQCSESQQSDGQDTTASTETVPSESTELTVGLEKNREAKSKKGAKLSKSRNKVDAPLLKK